MLPALPHTASFRRSSPPSFRRERLIVDPLRLLAWGTDASFYRLVSMAYWGSVC